MKTSISLIAIISLLSVKYTMAQTAMMKPDTGTYSFIMNASIGGMQEITSANVALKKAKSGDLKAYAAMMIADHTRIGAQLTQIVKAKGYQMPPQAMEKVLPNTVLDVNSGVAFDRVYADLMVADHQATVSLFQNYAAIGKDPELKAFAKQTLPFLKEHLALIKGLAMTVKPASL